MTEPTAQRRIAALRFQPLGKLYHFDASEVDDLRPGDHVLVSTSRGRELGQVVCFVENPQPPPEGGWKKIERRATAAELVLRQQWQSRELEALIECRAQAHEAGLRNVKIAGAEYAYDGSRVAFLFVTEGDEKPDLKDLRKRLQRVFKRAEVELRQVGPRDVAKMIGGMGACGLEERCCSRFLSEFSPISIKMAKAQGISLNPQEITGMCGRLRCCLIYEYEQYVEARKTLPKRNRRVVTPLGEGKVLDVVPLKQGVIVLLDDGRRVEFPLGDLQPVEELRTLEAKAMAPCGKHLRGECTCDPVQEDGE